MKTKIALAAVLLASATALAQAPSGIEDIRIRSVSLSDASVGDGARLLTDVSGYNVVATQDAAKSRVSFLLRDVSLKTSVETLCGLASLWYRDDPASRVLRIMTAQEYQRDLVVVRDAKTRVFTLLHPNAVVIATQIRDLYGPRVVLSLGLDETAFETRTSGTGDTAAQNGLIPGVVNGTPYGSGGAGSNAGQQLSTIDRDMSPERLAEMAKRRSESDGSQSRGSVSEADVEAAGSRESVIYVTVNRTSNLLLVRTADDRAVGEIETLVLELDRPTPQVLLEMKILELDLADGFKSIFDLSIADDSEATGPPDGQPANPLLPAAATGLKYVLGAGNFPLEGGTLLYQFLDERLRVRIQLLSTERRIRTVATPLLLCSNNREARLFVGEERPLVRNVTVVTSTTTGVVTDQLAPTVEIREIGTTLRIIPHINADRTVTLTLFQESSSVVAGGASLPVSTGSGSVTSFPVDTVNTASLEAVIVGRDHLALAVGGLIREEISDNEQKVPFLGDLPLLGFLFRREVRSRSKRELILLITPHVIVSPEEGERISRERLQSLSLHPWLKLADHALDAFSEKDLDGDPGMPEWIKGFVEGVMDNHDQH
ncbi:MAG: type II secretion system protein GspD [Candidatus Brocadiae bacterium]|nr:type II secretion system protein GspD [Candidatus Brocadiia bacterium]